MIVMGIESSCDETAVSLVERKKNKNFVRSEIVLSQIPKHRKFGGVVPEISSREHLKYLDKIVRKILCKSKTSINEIDAFSATMGPGLLGGLIIGSNYAKSLSLSVGKPFYGINHLQAHALIPRLKSVIKFPFLVLLVSGGHTQIILVKNIKSFEIWGETLDDALGEAFDKTAQMLGLRYPGGPEIEKKAQKSLGIKKFNFPKPMINQNNLDFSFSGLKTAVRRKLQLNNLSEQFVRDISFNFQLSVLECLINKCERAINLFRKKFDCDLSFIVSGGVAANIFIRKGFKKLAKEKGVKLIVPDPKYCVDNATMIAWACIERMVTGDLGDKLYTLPKPRWPLDTL